MVEFRTAGDESPVQLVCGLTEQASGLNLPRTAVPPLHNLP